MGVVVDAASLCADHDCCVTPSNPGSLGAAEVTSRLNAEAVNTQRLGLRPCHCSDKCWVPTFSVVSVSTVGTKTTDSRLPVRATSVVVVCSWSGS